MPWMGIRARAARAFERDRALNRAERRATERRIRALDGKTRTVKDTKARGSNTKARARRG